MGNVVVVGAQWGDEGKGKIVDWLSERADVIARFQGGHNAGHTLVIDGTVYKLSLLPSGIVRPGKLSVIGNGVVLDPWALLAEIEKLRGQGVAITPENLMIAENTPADPAAAPGPRPHARGGGRRGQDRHHRPRHRPGLRGQGRAAQRSASPTSATRRRSRPASTACSPTTTRSRRGLGAAPIDRAALTAELRRDRAEGAALRRAGLAGARREAPRGPAHPLRGRAGLAPRHRLRHLSLRHLVEHARRHGGAPAPAWGRARSTSSSASSRPTPPASAQGPFPAELDDAIGQRLGERGHEFGTVTGRKRRCGWFDAVLVRQTCTTSGVNGIALTKLDVLDGFEELKICVGYELDGERLDYLPTAAALQARVTPGLRDHGRLVGDDGRRALLGRAAGAGDQVRPPHRGADRLPGRAALDQPGAGRHHPRHRPLRHMNAMSSWPRAGAGRWCSCSSGCRSTSSRRSRWSNRLGRPGILVELLVYVGARHPLGDCRSASSSSASAAPTPTRRPGSGATSDAAGISSGIRRLGMAPRASRRIVPTGCQTGRWPMIVSHSRKFIFLKTRKTAGTSLEIALSKYCGPEDILAPINFDEGMRQGAQRRAASRTTPARSASISPIQMYRHLRRGEEVELFTEHMTAVAAMKRLGDGDLERLFQVHHRAQSLRPDAQPLLLVDEGAPAASARTGASRPSTVPPLPGRVRERELADLHPWRPDPRRRRGALRELRGRPRPHQRRASASTTTSTTT